MKTLSTTIGLSAALAAGAMAAAQAAPAFPGAQGWGKEARGGGQNASAKILFVTSLDDSGPGTLREALMASGPRIILFRTGGVIELKSSISFRNGDVTVAGQTAPGDGIIVKNYPIRIGASNVVMRGLRIRNGDGPGPKGDLRDSIQIGRVNGDTIRDVIVDHCSFGWSMDETAEFWYGARNVTLSNCIFSEALWKSQHEKGSHGYCMLFGNGPNDRITVYRNLFAHNERRNPWIKDNAKVEILNNVVYNWGSEATGLWMPGQTPSSFANIVGNYYKPGVDTAWSIKKGGKSINLGRPAPDGSRFFVKGNIGPGRENDTQPEWSVVQVGEFDANAFKAEEPIPAVASGAPTLSAEAAYDHVLRHAGALPRDAADRRAIEHTRAGTGKHIDALTEIGGYPAYAAGTYPTDTDGDGMPDAWETSRGLNPGDRSDATRIGAGGYLNIEDYINSLLPAEGAVADRK